MNNLPKIEFASKNVAQIEADIITLYEAIAERKLAPGDPVRLFLQAIAALIAQQRLLIDYAAKQNLLAYASGDYLDHIGAIVRTERIPAQPSVTTLKFTLSTAQPQAVVIPAGTRVTPDGQVFFAVLTDTTVAAGTLQIDVYAECTIEGTVGNGWQIGQINQLVDPLLWIIQVQNITVSSGGSDIESDDNYRQRIYEAPESFSVAGPEGAYKYWARTASNLISDVAVYSPAAGQVEIRPLLKDGEIPSQEILDAVTAICNSRSIRPLTDQVIVAVPQVVNYDVTIEYYVEKDRATEASAIQVAVTEAVNGYIAWQKERLGRDINPSELIARVMGAGAKRTTVTSPVFTQVQPYQVAVAGTVTVTYGGLEDA
ncbi:MAG: baseplate assembly protein [Syntrophomonadaceae bacterium]|jgi:phage-related baseplate assembly protein